MKQFFSILFFSALCLCYAQKDSSSTDLLSSLTAKDVRPYTNATLLKVLANPERYDDTTLTLIGFLSLDFEANGLYLHKDDSDYAIYGNALRIDASEKVYKQLEKLNNQYVVITGKFRDRGTTSFSGQLTEIENCAPRLKRKAEAPFHTVDSGR